MTTSWKQGTAARAHYRPGASQESIAHPVTPGSRLLGRSFRRVLAIEGICLRGRAAMVVQERRRFSKLIIGTKLLTVRSSWFALLHRKDHERSAKVGVVSERRRETDGA